MEIVRKTGKLPNEDIAEHVPLPGRFVASAATHSLTLIGHRRASPGQGRSAV